MFTVIEDVVCAGVIEDSLYRRLLWSLNALEAPKESDVARAEREILADVHRWACTWESTADCR